MCEIVTAMMVGGALLSGASSLAQGSAANSAAKAEAAQIEQQRETEAQLNNVKDVRLRQRFAEEIGRQRLGLAASGVSLDSPSAIALGRRAAAEMSFESQSVRSGGQATDRELSFASRSVRARGRNAKLAGVFNAATSVLSAGPKIFAGLDG